MIIVNKINTEFLLVLLYLSLRLATALRLSATPVLLCSDRRHANSRPRLMLPISNLTFPASFIGGRNRSTPKKPCDTA